MMKKNPDYLVSWLQWFDVNYLECIDAKLVDELAAFNINNPHDQDILIERFLLPEFMSSNDITQKSMLETLRDVPHFREADVRKVLARTMLFDEPLQDYITFFEKVRRRCELLQARPSGAHAVNPSNSSL